MKFTRSIGYSLAFMVLLGNGVQAQALDPRFLQCAVYISFNRTPTLTVSGTGFLVTRDNAEQIFLVTNKHVLPAEGKPKSIKVRVAAALGSSDTVQEIEIPIVGPDGKYLSTVSRHKDPDVDVAAVHISEQVKKYKIPGRWLAYNVFASKEQILKRNISVGDEVFLLGYPDAIYDPRNVSPVLRVGTIATVPSDGYAFNDRLKNTYGLPERIDGFLIDANVYPGSSGSLVILKPQFGSIAPNGHLDLTGVKRFPLLLGIVSKSIPIDDSAMGSKQRMGLGVVYSADTVKETIEQFYGSTSP